VPRKDLPALILLDPRSCFGTEGYELLRTLCVYQTLAQIPLVLFTAAPLSSDFAQEQDSRIWYAAKPVRTADYMDLVTRCVQQRLHQPATPLSPQAAPHDHGQAPDQRTELFGRGVAVSDHQPAGALAPAL
jgi:hypothetical protein